MEAIFTLYLLGKSSNRSTFFSFLYSRKLSIGNKNIYRNIESRNRTILYSVKQGDNLFKISELFDVTIKSIEEINNFNQATLMPGQIIKIAIRAF